MPEEDIETQDLKERLEEAHEHAAHGHHTGPNWLTWLSLSTAIVAVFAAVSALESGSHANDAIVQKNDAILHQSRADDSWSYYQAKGIEATVLETAADGALRPELEMKFRAAEAHAKDGRTETRQHAEEEEKQVAQLNERSERSLHVHHQFAKSVTIFQVAIALSAIAALTRRKPMWWVSLAIGGVGVAFFALGLVTPS